MPNRIIRDSSKTSPSLAGLSDLAERTFWRIIVTLDDFGRYHGSEMVLLAAAFPVPPDDLTPKKFSAALAELEAGDLIRFYESGGRRYVFSPTWQKYQRLRARDSQFPDPLYSVGGGHRAATCQQGAVISPPSAAGVGVGVGVGNGEKPLCSKNPSTQFPEGFLDFYNAYPKDRRKGRFEAVSEWRKLRLTAPQITQLMASLASWIASRDWRKDDGKYIPLPKNFLKTRRWEETVEREPDELDWLRQRVEAPK